MSRLPPPLTKAQRYLLMELRLFAGVIHMKRCPVLGALEYSMLKYPGEPKAYEIHPDPRTIKALIHKGALVPELSDKEFAIQLALGTVDCRVY
ncbi:hypothetical protein LCGC14_2350380, partial [marine sediment metagenome]